MFCITALRIDQLGYGGICFIPKGLKVRPYTLAILYELRLWAGSLLCMPVPLRLFSRLLLNSLFDSQYNSMASTWYN